MAVKGKICLVFLLLAAVVFISASASFGVSKNDEEIRVCKMMCEYRSGEQDDKPKCIRKCEEYHPDQQKKERESGKGRGGGRGGDQHDIIFAVEEQDVKKIVEDCHRSCQGSQGEQQRPQCFKTCMQKRFQDQEKSRSRDTQRPERTRRTGRQQQQSNNPYVFNDQHFTARLETEHGNVRVLQKFTDRSDLFQGIEKYRVAYLEAEPQTFIIPNFWDADALIFVEKGQGTITLIQEDSRQSHDIKRGDLFLVPAGINAYLTNKDNNEQLVLAKILRSVSVPGDLELFSVGGGGNRESSIYNAFSTEVLEAAFDVDRDSLERIVGQQRQQEQGMFKKATKEQIQSLSGKDEGSIWPFSRKEKGTYSIFKKDPSVENENGNLREVDSNEFSDLRDLNVAFSFFNISRGSMAGPFYNTKATQILMIPNGVGWFEMACPHLSDQATRTGQINPTYEKVSSELRQGTVVVVPAGHPVVIEASGEDNLEVIGFGLKSDENEWFPLAGKDNVMSQWEDEAIELTFGSPASEVKSVIEKQNKKLFFKGPVRSGRAFA